MGDDRMHGLHFSECNLRWIGMREKLHSKLNDDNLHHNNDNNNNNENNDDNNNNNNNNDSNDAISY